MTLTSTTIALPMEAPTVILPNDLDLHNYWPPNGSSHRYHILSLKSISTIDLPMEAATVILPNDFDLHKDWPTNGSPLPVFSLMILNSTTIDLSMTPSYQWLPLMTLTSTTMDLPIAAPTVILPTRINSGPLAKAIRSAPTVNTTEVIIIAICKRKNDQSFDFICD